MKVEVTGEVTFKQILGDRQPLVLEIENGTTLEELLNILSRRLGEPFAKLVFGPDRKGVKGTVLVILNGTPHWNLRDRLVSTLAPGDAIQLSPIMAGG